MKFFQSIMLTALFFGCAIQANAAEDYITNAADIVKAADWKQMQTITVTFDEFSYEPENIELRAGQPYKMVLKNRGQKKHYFTAPEFYRAIATRKVQSNKDGEIKAPYFTALELMVGGQLDLYFVPVTVGEYHVFCTIDDHREEGMEGKLVIRQAGS
jgi:uncharacterized cupredoxin-like copper-binding protein